MKASKILLPIALGILSVSGCRKSAPTEPQGIVSGVTITSPDQYSTVTDTLVVRVSVVSDKSIVKVGLYVDDKLDSSQVRFAPPYDFVWIAPDEPDSTVHSLVAKAYQSDYSVLSSSPLKVVVRSFAPSDLHLVAVSEASLTLAWKDNCKFETGFLIEQSVQNSPYTQIDSVGPNTESATITGPFQTNVDIAIRIRAIATGKLSKYSNIATTKIWFPAPVISKFYSATDSTIVITWRDSSGLARNFEIERSTDGVSFTLARTVDSSANVQGEFSTIFDELFVMGQMYYFRLRGASHYNHSPYSAIISTTPHFGAPSPPNLLSSTPSTITLTWATAGRFAQEISVERSVGNQQFHEIGRVDAQSNVYSDSGLSGTATYQYRLRGLNGGSWSDYSDVLALRFVRDGTYSFLRMMTGTSGVVMHVSFTSDDQEVAAIGADHSVSFWDIHTGLVARKIPLAQNAGSDYTALCTSDNYVAVCDTANLVRIFEIRSGRLVAAWPGGDGNWMSGVAISPDETLLALVTTDALWVYQFPSGGFKYSANAGQYAVSFSTDGTLIGTGSNWSYASIFTAATGNKVTSFKCPGYAAIRGVEFSPDAQLLAFGGDEGTLSVWRISDETVVSRSPCYTQIRGLSYSPDGRAIATAGDGDTLRIWRLDGQKQSLLPGGWGGGVRFSHDGSFLVCAVDLGRLCLYQASGNWQPAGVTQQTATARGRAAPPNRRHAH